jgi:hypothetical protein
MLGYFVPFAICLGVSFLIYPRSAMSGNWAMDGLTLLWLESAYVLLAGVLCLGFLKVSGVLDEPSNAVLIERYLPARVASVLLETRTDTRQ